MTTIASKVLKFAKANPDGFRSAQVSEAIKEKKQRVAVVLWKLKRDGVLNHDGTTGIYKLTDVNVAEAKVKAKRAKARSVVATKTVSPGDYKYLLDRAASLNKAHEDLIEKYEDALAIIRYLEDKMFKAIRFASNNGNL